MADVQHSTLHTGDTEASQDAVGSILVDSASVDFTYDDATPSITAVVLPAGVSHASLANLTTGDPHTQYLTKAFVNAKGDIVTASANDTPSILTVGADDTILMADAAAGSGLKWVASATPGAVSTANAAGTADTFSRGDHVHAHETAHVAHDTIFDAKGDLPAGTGADTASVLTVGANDTILMADSAAGTGLKWVASATPSTQAFGDAATVGTADTFTRGDHLHGMPALGTSATAIGTSAGGAATTPSKSDHVHATGAGTPSTQAFADAAATGSGPAASMTDHKHAMPTLGYALTGNSTPAVALSQASGFVTSALSVTAATYADLTGASVSLAAGTWLVVGQVFGSAVNLAFLAFAAITDNANTIVSEGSTFVSASGTASVHAWGAISLAAIVTPGSTTTYKLRVARGLTTLTNSWTAQDGSGLNTTNNASDNTDKGSGIFAIRIA